jgi:hypothetical protein
LRVAIVKPTRKLAIRDLLRPAAHPITRGRLDPETRACLQRKEAEGKTRMEAMRCLERHLARGYRLLSDR